MASFVQSLGKDPNMSFKILEPELQAYRVGSSFKCSKLLEHATYVMKTTVTYAGSSMSLNIVTDDETFTVLAIFNLDFKKYCINRNLV